MPRNASGDYSLPAGNPVTSGTPISSAVQNSTMSDIASALTDSLSRSGKGGMLVPFTLADGTTLNPSLAFTGEPTTGLYRPAAGQLGVAVLGLQVAYFAADGVYSQQPFRQWNGATYDTLLAGNQNAVITGAWEFNQVLSVVAGINHKTKGRYTYHNDAALTSGAIFISTVDPVVGNGADGDIWYKI
jgi:hypothetical protein